MMTQTRGLNINKREALSFANEKVEKVKDKLCLVIGDDYN